VTPRVIVKADALKFEQLWPMTWQRRQRGHQGFRGSIGRLSIDQGHMEI